MVRTPHEEPGPSLQTYLETRLNLMATALGEARDVNDKAISQLDRRYQERHDDQEKRWADRSEADRQAVRSAFLAATTAIQKVEATTEKRFESVNEFRATLSDQQRTFIPRSEVGALLNGLNDKVAALTTVVERLQAERAGIKGGWGYAVGVVGFIVALLALLSQLRGG